MRNRSEKIEIPCTTEEKKRIIANAKRNNMGNNVAEFMRTLGLSNVRITVTVELPQELHVDDAHLGQLEQEGRDEKRAAG